MNSEKKTHSFKHLRYKITLPLIQIQNHVNDSLLHHIHISKFPNYVKFNFFALYELDDPYDPTVAISRKIPVVLKKLITAF